VTNQSPVFHAFGIFVKDMAASLAFYRRLGLTIPDSADREVHVEAELPGGIHMQFDTIELTKGYDPGWEEPAGGSRTLFQFEVPTRDAVDDLFGELTGAGYNGHQAPFDAFWGSRYAAVYDPDGNLVGLRSPRDPARGGPPPGI
jgi:catechol 2,3-dioxygenase-like lactoylglutathione lyase family enzyme